MNQEKKRSQTIAEKIMNVVGDKQECMMMEYGCATGLIYDIFKKLTLIDYEDEMINIVRKKVY